MDLGRMDHVAMRAAEQAVVRTSAADRPTPRRTAVIGTRVPIVLDPERIDALAAAGYMTDADDRDTDPSRGRRRLIATERGRIEWRCACAEDPALEMEMDDIFRRAGEIVTVDIDDRRYFVTGSEGPLPQGDEWTVTHDPADPENDIEAMTCYRRIVAVDAIANHLGELLTSWNPTDREPVGYPRMPAYPTGSRIIMSAAIMIALDGAVNTDSTIRADTRTSRHAAGHAASLHHPRPATCCCGSASSVRSHRTWRIDVRISRRHRGESPSMPG